MAVQSIHRTLAAAVRVTVDAIDPPPSDAALVAVAESIAETVDAMAPGQRMTLAPQHMGQLVKVLGELEARAVKRRAPLAPGRGAAPANPVDDLRRAHARRVARGGRAG
jgi:hypothetical protein